MRHAPHAFAFVSLFASSASQMLSPLQSSAAGLSVRCHDKDTLCRHPALNPLLCLHMTTCTQSVPYYYY